MTHQTPSLFDAPAAPADVDSRPRCAACGTVIPPRDRARRTCARCTVTGAEPQTFDLEPADVAPTSPGEDVAGRLDVTGPEILDAAAIRAAVDASEWAQYGDDCNGARDLRVLLVAEALRAHRARTVTTQAERAAAAWGVIRRRRASDREAREVAEALIRSRIPATTAEPGSLTASWCTLYALNPHGIAAARLDERNVPEGARGYLRQWGAEAIDAVRTVTGFDLTPTPPAAVPAAEELPDEDDDADAYEDDDDDDEPMPARTPMHEIRDRLDRFQAEAEQRRAQRTAAPACPSCGSPNVAGPGLYCGPCAVAGERSRRAELERAQLAHYGYTAESIAEMIADEPMPCYRCAHPTQTRASRMTDGPDGRRAYTVAACPDHATGHDRGTAAAQMIHAAATAPAAVTAEPLALF